MTNDKTDLLPHQVARLSGSKLATYLNERSKYDVKLVSAKGSPRRYRVSYDRHKVWLQERLGGASIQLEVSRRDRRSLGTDDWVFALAEAERLIELQSLAHMHNVALDEQLASLAGEPDLEPVIVYYKTTRFVDDPDHPHYVGPHHRKRLERVWAIVRHLFGTRRPISWYGREFVSNYIDARTTRRIVFPDRWNRRPCKKARVRTAVAELKDFASVLAFARRKDKIGHNPLADYPWEEEWLQGDKHAVEHMEEAHTRRHSVLMQAPNRVDPDSGERLSAPINRIRTRDRGARARCIEALLFHTGHRVISVLSLMCEDVALTRKEMRKLLRAAPNHREWWADHWPCGAIFWRRSKVDFVRITPISRLLRREIDRWKGKHPDWRPGMPVFPQQRNPAKPILYDHMNKWMNSALRHARTELETQAVSTAQIDRWLGGSLLHGWRDHWATMMDRLAYGWDAATGEGGRRLQLHNHVAFMGDWATSGGTQAEVYAKLNPGILQAIAEFEHAADVVKRFSQETKLELEEVFTSIYEEGDEDDVIPITRSRIS